ncbi:MAG: bifunctional diguanylate cyclase/phosphodiesterase [Myxococcales bacterium]|nr:bifunctional diguanylate cyclase/phosphodiesterase [Myxococcales bacterium]
MNWSIGPEAHDLQLVPELGSATSRKILLLMQEKADEELIGGMVDQFDEQGWTSVCAKTMDEAMNLLHGGGVSAWIVDSRVVSHAGINIRHLVQSQEIDTALLLLVAGDNPFAAASMVIDWAEVLVREEMNSVELLGTIQRVVAAREEQIEWERRVRQDRLTGLLNRVGISETISRMKLQADQERQRFGVWVVRVDSYVSLTHRYGKLAGANLLQAVGRRLLSVVGREDAVGRLDPYAFVVILGRIVTVQDGEEASARLMEMVRAPYDLQIPVTSVDADCGLSVYPDSLCAPEAMLASAKWVLGFTNERTGPEVVGPPWSDKPKKMGDLSLVTSDIYREIDWGGLEIVVQPQVDLGSGQPFCLEALARWASDVPGSSDVTKAIHALECSGRIFELDLWMLEHAVKLAEPYWGRIERIAVNISPVTLMTPGFLDRLGAILPENTGCLELELTETALLSNIDQAAKMLHVLRAMGVRVALDDFGRGYSSLLRLQELPLDTLKLDRDFVQRLDSDARARAIVDSLLALAARLELEVVVEGVETEAQARQLASLGVRKGQGFWYAKPMSDDELSGWIRHPEAMRNLSEKSTQAYLPVI